VCTHFLLHSQEFSTIWAYIAVHRQILCNLFSLTFFYAGSSFIGSLNAACLPWMSHYLSVCCMLIVNECCCMIDSESRVPAGGIGGGQFRLDLDDTETNDVYQMPKLNELDLHEILDEPVKLPVTKWVIFCHKIQLSFIMHNLCDKNNSTSATFRLCLSGFFTWVIPVRLNWKRTVGIITNQMPFMCLVNSIRALKGEEIILMVILIFAHVCFLNGMMFYMCCGMWTGCQIYILTLVWLCEWRLRPPSPAVKLLHTSTDAKSAVDLVVSQIASNDIQTSLQALHQVSRLVPFHCATRKSCTHYTTDYILSQFLGRITYAERGLSVCVFVCVSETLMSCAKMVEPIDMQFGLWTGVGLCNCVLDGGPEGKGSFGVEREPANSKVCWDHGLEALKRRLAWSRWRLVRGLPGAHGTVS